MAEAQQRRRLQVRGRVQGVAFRACTRDAAAQVGANGWVRNREDGSVEAVIEGSATQVRAMLAFCREGPRFARVDELDVQAEPPEGLRGFEIR
ncbi:MAG: acylphosphatase [Deltaproteobacteria bacterium]|nr:acylphosphatase [Deltaproteobacteria bacterium]MBW2395088.1 acylphosphatase [Deltaproteobacteria bacterium]